MDCHLWDEALAESILVALEPVDDRLKMAWTHILRKMWNWWDEDVGMDGAGLFLALYHRQKAAFLALIDRTYIPTTKKRRTPFIIAAYLGLPDFIELMVKEWGADDSHSKQNPSGSQLPRTEEPDNIQVHVASPDDAGYTPLWYAVREGHTAVVKLLLQYPATQVNTSNEYGWTPLMLAASRGLDDAAELLLKCPMLDINSQDTDGETALWIAAENGFHTFVRLLLEYPAIDVNLADHDGVSPLFAASDRGDGWTLKPPLDYQTPFQPADSLQNAVRPDVRESADGSHPQQNPRIPSHPQLPQTQEPDSIQVHVASPDIQGNTPLSHAAREDHTAVVKLLLQYPATQVNKPNKYGITPLMFAAYRGFDGAAAWLLKCPMLDINSRAHGGKTALRIAAEMGFHNLVKLLLKHPAIDVNLADHEGVSPFLAALKRGDTSILKLLLDYHKPSQPVDSLQDTVKPDVAIRQSADDSHSKLNPDNPQLPQTQEPDNVQIHVALPDKDGDTSLSHAASGGHTAVVKLLLQYPATQVNTSNKFGSTPLMLAAHGGFDGVAELLLGCPMLDINSQDIDGKTALKIASEKGSHTFVKLLLKHPAIDVNLADHNGVSPFLAASMSGDTSTLKLLLDYQKPSQSVGSLQDTVGPDIAIRESVDDSHPKQNPSNPQLLQIQEPDNIQVHVALPDTDGDTPLSHAASGGHTAAVKLLLQYPATQVNTSNKSGNTPLMLAAKGGFDRVAELLLKCPMLEINSRNHDGETALWIAAGEGSHTFVKLLLEHPAIDVNLADHNGVSPYLAALESENIATLELFLDYRKPSQPVDPLQDTVRPLTVDVNARNERGCSALEIAAWEGSLRAVELLLDYTDIDPDLRSNRGCSPLAMASEKGHTDIVQLLLDRAEVNINNIDNDGDTPLTCASYNGHTSVARLLLVQPGIQVNVQDGRGRTALSRACDAATTRKKTEAEAYPFVALLLEHKDIDVNLADEAGRTPLYYASLSGFQKVAELMQRRGAVMSSEAESTPTNVPS